MAASTSWELPHDPAHSVRLLASAAADWDATWQADGPLSGRLRLPVLAGIRRGQIYGRVTLSAEAKGSRLTFHPEEQTFEVLKPQLVLLILAALGGLTLMAAPLFPVLVPLVPLSLLLVLGAWFVVANLRNSGPEEFFGGLAVAGEPAADRLSANPETTET